MSASITAITASKSSLYRDSLFSEGMFQFFTTYLYGQPVKFNIFWNFYQNNLPFKITFRCCDCLRLFYVLCERYFKIVVLNIFPGKHVLKENIKLPDMNINQLKNISRLSIENIWEHGDSKGLRYIYEKSP